MSRLHIHLDGDSLRSVFGNRDNPSSISAKHAWLSRRDRYLCSTTHLPGGFKSPQTSEGARHEGIAQDVASWTWMIRCRKKLACLEASGEWGRSWSSRPTSTMTQMPGQGVYSKGPGHSARTAALFVLHRLLISSASPSGPLEGPGQPRTSASPSHDAQSPHHLLTRPQSLKPNDLLSSQILRQNPDRVGDPGFQSVGRLSSETASRSLKKYLLSVEIRRQFACSESFSKSDAVGLV